MSGFALLIAIQLLAARTASTEKTLSTAMLFVSYGVLSFLLIQSLRHTRQVRRLAHVISIYGAAVAVFAMIQGLTPNGKIYWLLTPRFGGWIYGPYVNHNHYAGLMEMLTPVPLVISLSRHLSIRHRWLAGLASVLMGGSILLCGSRGGMISLAAELLLLIAILGWQRTGGKAIGSIAAIASAILILSLWLGSSQLAERLSSIRIAANSEISNGTRLNIDRDGLRMFVQRPLLGWGLGTFPIIYPKFRSFYTDLYVDHAHNDYIQLLVETGSVGLGLMLWFVAMALTNAARKIKRYGLHTNGLIGMATLLGIAGILVHSLVDFNLEIPANAAIFVSLCALAVADPGFGLHPTHSRKA
jgi:O-antigen ligase